MKYSYSIILPTFKNHEMFLRTLESIRNQTNLDFELVVINNNEEDGLKDKLIAYNEKYPELEILYVNYPLDGAYGARSVGMTNSKGDVIISIDDDETCDPNLVQTYIDFFETHHDVVMAGGSYTLTFDSPAPDWVLEYLKDKKTDYVWGHYEPYDEVKIGEAINVWGGNMAMRRPIFEWTGWYPGKNNGISLGPHESGMVLDVADKPGALMAFLPDAKIYHHMPASRLTLKHLRWSAAYTMNSRMFKRYKTRKISLPNIIADYFRAIGEYYKLWIKDFFFAKGKTDMKSLDTQYLASMGYWKMRYLTWIFRDKGKIREVLEKHSKGHHKYDIDESKVKITRLSAKK